MRKISFIFLAFLISMCFSFSTTNNTIRADNPESESLEIKQLISEIYISSLDEVKNRTAGSHGESAFADILSGKLSEMGLSFLPEIESFTQSFSISDNKTSKNVIGFKNNNSENYVVIGAHYDSIYLEGLSYGFNDNLSGVVGTLQLAKKLSEVNLNYNIIVVFYGAEEVGCLGSKYFLSKLSYEIKNNILLSVNFDSIGSGDKLYYFHTDYPTQYGNIIDSFLSQQANGFNKPNTNRLFSSLFNNDLNYTTISLNSDNSSYIKQGINSLFFFAGDLDTNNGLGFFEKQGYSKIMHNTDTEQVNISVFGDLFYENISAITDLCFNLFADESFNESNFYAGQIDVMLYSDWVLKILGVILIALIITGFYIFVNLKDKKKKQ